MDIPEFPPQTWNMLVGYATRTLGALALLAVAGFLSRWAGRAVEASLDKARVEKTLTKFAGTSARWAVLVLAGVMALGTFGVQTTSFAAIIGASGLAIGLALQGTLSHFAAGVMLLVFRPFRVGDTVEIGGRRGKVDAIELLFTTIDTPDNRRFVLPNGQVFGAAIENVTFHPVRRADIPVGTPYDEDLDRVRAALQTAAAAVPGQVPDKPPAVVLTGLGDSAILWEVRVWSPKDDWLAVAQATRRQVKIALDDAGIGIPFPQMDVHLDGGLRSGS